MDTDDMTYDFFQYLVSVQKHLIELMQSHLSLDYTLFGIIANQQWALLSLLLRDFKILWFCWKCKNWFDEKIIEPQSPHLISKPSNHTLPVRPLCWKDLGRMLFIKKYDTLLNYLWWYINKNMYVCIYVVKDYLRVTQHIVHKKMPQIVWFNFFRFFTFWNL